MWITKKTIESFMIFLALLFYFILIFTPFCYCYPVSSESGLNNNGKTNQISPPTVKNLNNDNDQLPQTKQPNGLQSVISQIGQYYQTHKKATTQPQDSQLENEYQNTEAESAYGNNNMNNMETFNAQNVDEELYQVPLKSAKDEDPFENMQLGMESVDPPSEDENPFENMQLGMEPDVPPSAFTSSNKQNTIGQNSGKNNYPITPSNTIPDKLDSPIPIDEENLLENNMLLDNPPSDTKVIPITNKMTPENFENADELQDIKTKMPLEPIDEDMPLENMPREMLSEDPPSDSEDIPITNQMMPETFENVDEFQNTKTKKDQTNNNQKNPNIEENNMSIQNSQNLQKIDIDDELRTDTNEKDLLDPGIGKDTNVQKHNKSNRKKLQRSIRTDKQENPLNKIKIDMPVSGKKGKKIYNKGSPFEMKSIDDSRVFCTFKNNVSKMYKKVKKHFVGDLCHAIVFGTPLVIYGHRIKINEKLGAELKEIHTYKNDALLIVIIKHKTYEEWSEALDNPKKEVETIMRYVKEYYIDGIQFSNLQPTALDQLDTNMLCKLIEFFNMLIKSARNSKIDLKIGIGISSYSQSISSSFESFEVLNNIVTWYSIHTISMIKCSPSHLTGTSPLRGDVSWESTINQLISTDIDKKKIVIGIQLYPNTVDSLKPSTYLDMCLANKNTWDQWCAERPQHFREKGVYLRNLEIWGVQLYYMESDDFKARCHCFSFPMIRALLRGLASKGPPENCPFLGDVVNKKSKCLIPNIIDNNNGQE